MVEAVLVFLATWHVFLAFSFFFFAASVCVCVDGEAMGASNDRAEGGERTCIEVG